MIDSPDTAWTKQQVADHLIRISQLLRSDVFSRNAPFTDTTQTRWITLINAVSDLLRQALLAGKRIDFATESGTSSNPRDITGLLESMRMSAYVIRTDKAVTIITPTINHFYGAGTGQFANGLEFNCEYEQEMAFFIGTDRVYFYRHLLRAFLEARRYLIKA